MGTLFSQPERNYRSVHENTLKLAVKYYAEIAKANNCSVADVAAVKAALERERSNDLYANDGDIKDEHLAGFGELLREFIDVLREAKDDQGMGAFMVKEAIEGLADAVDKFTAAGGEK